MPMAQNAYIFNISILNIEIDTKYHLTLEQGNSRIAGC